jgi:hypothetical protein
VVANGPGSLFLTNANTFSGGTTSAEWFLDTLDNPAHVLA